jgi:hypothetical protein
MYEKTSGLRAIVVVRLQTAYQAAAPVWPTAQVHGGASVSPILRRTPGVGMPVCDRALAGGAALRSSTAAIIAIAAKNATRERE